MENIPVEIWTHIFSYLHGKNRKNARFVCRKWRGISYAYPLFQNEVVVINNYRDLIASYVAEPDIIHDFNPVNMILLIKKKDITLGYNSEEGKDFWRSQGSKLRSLVVSIASDHFKILLDILMHCHNLEHLQVNAVGNLNGQSIDISCFKEVTFKRLLSLGIKGGRCLIYPLLQHAIVKASKLTSITAICIFDLRVHPPIGSLVKINQACSLEGIGLDCFNASNEFIEKLTLTIGPKLKTLLIDYGVNLSDWSLVFLGQRCKELRKLKLGYWCGGNRHFRELFLGLTKLTVVSLYQSRSLNDEGVASLGVIPGLTHLCISSCSNVTDSGISKLFGEIPKPLMIELRLVDLNITDNLIVNIAKVLPNLKILNLNYCIDISKASLKAVATYNPSLQCLLISYCADLNLPLQVLYQGVPEIVAIINRLSKLVHLSVCDLDFVSDFCNVYLQLPSLTILEYASFPNDVNALLKRCPSLKYVNDLCCETMEINSDPIIEALRKLRLLNCATSPLGPCFRTNEFPLD